jgi:hypothetical protein
MTTTNNPTDELAPAIAEAVGALGYGEKENLSGYELAKLTSAIKGFEVKPQMVYNYIKKGLIKSVEVDGRKMVQSEVAIAWVIKYITHNA